MDILNEIKNRRSCRKFKEEMPSSELIDRVVEAGLYAACGMGYQYGKILVVTNKEIRNKISKLNTEIAGRTSDTFYGAPVILLVLVKKYRNAPYDGACMIENMMLEASSLGLGSCWIHRAKEELESIEGREILKESGLNLEEYEGVGHVALGYADVTPPEKKIKEERVIYIR